MDFSKYSGETISLITKVLETAQNPNSHVFASLRKLEKISKDSKDDELLGFVYYYYALAYISRKKHKELMEHLKIAIRHLLRVDDKDLLARAEYALSPGSKSDVIIRYFIERKVYDIFVINIALHDHGLPILE